MQNESPLDRLAVLIDADNAEAALFETVFAEIASLGEATVKRIYGDFTRSQLGAWKNELQRFAIRPMQQFAYTTGKNATDSALIIDAMDLLHSGLFDGFCILSSDSDYTGLATRLRESGKKVYGFGRNTTPPAFKNACHRFFETDHLKHPSPEASPGTNAPKEPSHPNPVAETAPSKPASAAPVPSEASPHSLPKALITKIRETFDKVSDENGWVHLGVWGGYFRQLQTDFDPRNYGCTNSKLSTFVKTFSDLFEWEERFTDPQKPKDIYIRLRSPKETR